MKRILVLFILGLLVAPAAAVAAQPHPLLSAIDVPLTAENAARLGLNEGHAMAALEDTTSVRYVRQRSISALPIFGTKAGRAGVEKAAASDIDETVRIQAVTSLARGFAGTPADRAAVLATLDTLSKTAPPAVAEAIAGERKWLAAQAPAKP